MKPGTRNLTARGEQADWRTDFLETHRGFYLLKHQREDLLDRMKPSDPATAASPPPGNLVLANVENPATHALAGQGVLNEVTTIPELDGRAFFVLYRR